MMVPSARKSGLEDKEQQCTVTTQSATLIFSARCEATVIRGISYMVAWRVASRRCILCLARQAEARGGPVQRFVF